MFHKATIKLTALYLGILMLISLAFSFSLYQISIRELSQSLQHQSDMIMSGPRFRLLFDDPSVISNNQAEVLHDSEEHLLLNLAIVNVSILVAGGFLSYILARRTLWPIEEAHRAQSRFTADASHELRTPISAMQTEIEVALMDPRLKLSGAKKQLSSNLEELAKLTALSEGLLGLAKLENSKLDKQAVNLSEVVKAATDRAMALAGKKSITIETKYEEPIKVLADRAALEEALLTILDNAIKYSPAKSVVKINVYTQQKFGFVSIEDKGIGISDSDLPHIFERFYRADAARSKQTGNGYGLGLSIAKNVIDVLDGDIDITSQLNKGSTFTIKLPIYDK